MEVNYDSNITFRKPYRTNSLNDICNETRSETSLFDTTMLSIPGSSSLHDSNENVSNLTEQLKTLTEQLTCAHQEIEALNSENVRLKFDLQNALKLVDTYKICHSPGKKIMTPRSPPKRKPEKSTKPIKQTVTDTQLSIGTQTNTLPIKYNKETQTISHSKQTPQLQRKIIVSPNKYEQNILNTTSDTHNKICIISENKHNNIYAISKKILAEKNTCICHYLLPNSGINNLLNNLEGKLSNYSLEDFCVILIGETDFKTTKNYFSLIYYIRETLKRITHTNIILCVPTYKYSNYATMYNWRVENFNNLLYLDVITHGHVYFLDTNKNLTCDYRMFTRRTGVINDHGMCTIFTDIRQLINYIKEHTPNMTRENNLTKHSSNDHFIFDQELTNNQSETQFFRS